MNNETRFQTRLVIIATAIICDTVLAAMWSESGPIAMALVGLLSSVLFLLLFRWEYIFVRKYKKKGDFSREYQKEWERIDGQRKLDEESKLDRILAYTRTTFIQLRFDEEDVHSICYQVEYFIRHGTADETCLNTIVKRSDVTQASLKNFAWNIGYQYGINRMATAAFVMKLFSQWFYNTEKLSVYRTLKTTGAHAICASTEII